MSVPPWTTSLLRRLRKWVTNRSRVKAEPSLTNARTRLAIEQWKGERCIRCQPLHPRPREFSLTIDVLWLLKDLATCCSSLLLSAFCPFKKKKKEPILLYLLIPRGTIKVQKVTSCVTSVLSWNTQCVNFWNTGWALHARGAFRTDGFCSGGWCALLPLPSAPPVMESEDGERWTGSGWWSPQMYKATG